MTAGEIVKEMQSVLEEMARETENSIKEFEVQKGKGLMSNKETEEAEIAKPILKSFVNHLRSWRPHGART
jgi:16S rRNA C1402 (ribose-2'-O) methylase RsmI